MLVEGDDMNEPIADTARSLLDGHIVLARRLASEGNYPAVDVLASLSRVMTEIVPRAQQDHATKVRAWLAAHRDAEDLIQIGAYARGSNAVIDEALVRLPRIQEFLRQRVDEPATLPEAEAALAALVA